MSGLAHYLEDEGLATVVVALVREHAEKMRPPRALWVSFELGRPFGAPGDAALQGRVLRAALELLDRDGPGPVLEDFPEDAPHPDGEPGWSFPGSLDSTDLLRELESVRPLWQQARERFGRTTVGISGLEPEMAMEYLARYHGDDPLPNPRGMGAVSRARFAVDDVKAFYLEAAAARGGHPSSAQLMHWFWEQTLAGEMIREFQDRCASSEDQNLRLIAFGLVPAERVNALRVA